MSKTLLHNPSSATTSADGANEGRLGALLPAAVAVTVLTLLIFAYASYVKGLFGLQLNEIGDAIAGFASFLAFLWLIVTVVLQYSELRLQRQEIADLRAASEDQAKTLRMTNRIHTLTLLRSRQEDIVPYVKQGVEANARIVADFLGEILGFQHPNEFLPRPQAGLPYIYGYFILEDRVDDQMKLKDAITGGSLRRDFDYRAFLKLDDLASNMEDIWDVLKPVWLLSKQVDATEEYFAWQTSVDIKWYPEQYSTICALVRELRIIVSSGAVGSPIQRLVSGAVLDREKEELRAGRMSSAFLYSSDADSVAAGVMTPNE